MPAGPAAELAALDHLYQGQSNDCYWHGVFGGIYIAHMRLATYEHLIAAEDLADRRGPAPPAAPADPGRRRRRDLDGVDEIVARTAGPGRRGDRPDRGRRASGAGTSGPSATR